MHGPADRPNTGQDEDEDEAKIRFNLNATNKLGHNLFSIAGCAHEFVGTCAL